MSQSTCSVRSCDPDSFQAEAVVVNALAVETPAFVIAPWTEGEEGRTG